MTNWNKSLFVLLIAWLSGCTLTVNGSKRIEVTQDDVLSKEIRRFSTSTGDVVLRKSFLAGRHQLKFDNPRFFYDIEGQDVDVESVEVVNPQTTVILLRVPQESCATHLQLVVFSRGKVDSRDVAGCERMEYGLSDGKIWVIRAVQPNYSIPVMTVPNDVIVMTEDVRLTSGHAKRNARSTDMLKSKSKSTESGEGGLVDKSAEAKDEMNQSQGVATAASSDRKTREKANFNIPGKVSDDAAARKPVTMSIE